MPKNDFSKFLELIRPYKTFDKTLHPPSPDYSIDYNWAAKPNINVNSFMFQIIHMKLTNLMM